MSSSVQDSSQYSGRSKQCCSLNGPTRSLNSKSYSPFNNAFVTVLKASIMISIIVTFIFYSFFNSLAKSRYLSFFSLSFNFILWSDGSAKSTILISFFFITIRAGLLAEIK